MYPLYSSGLSIFKLAFVFLISIPFYSYGQWTQMGWDIDGEDSLDLSGSSVSMNGVGDRLAIGAIGNRNQAGHVRVYEWIGNASMWTQIGKDINGEAEGDFSGWSVSLNSLGNRLVIGANHNNGNGTRSGHVRVYEWNGMTWVQLGTDIDGEEGGDQFGWTVNINSDGDRIAVGAPFNNENGFKAGHVRIYEWDGVAWSQLGADLVGEFANDYLGSSLSLSGGGNRIAIGAPRNDGIGPNSGHVRIYEWNKILKNWVQLGTEIDGEAANNFSGSSLSLNKSGNRIAMGAPQNNGNGINSGHVRVYEWDSTQTEWIQLGLDIDGEAADDESGSSVSLNATGNLLVIGAKKNDESGDNSGHVRVYEWDTTSAVWIQIGLDIDGEAEKDNSGEHLCINDEGNRIVIGAKRNNGNGTNSGHARAYNFGRPCINAYSIDTIRACDSIVWINGVTYFSSNTSTKDTLINNSGCDTIVSLDLTILNLDVSVINLGEAIFAAQSGNSYQWLDCDADTIIPRATGIGFKPDTTGNYAVIIDNGSCFDTSVCSLVRVVGLEENINDLEFRIFPNPTSENITIKSRNSMGEFAQITSITGAILLEFKITQEKETIDLSGFQNGLYFLRVGNQIRKIIVAR